MIKYKENHTLVDRLISKPDKGLGELQKYLRQLIDSEDTERVENITSYFIFRCNQNQSNQQKIALIQGIQCIAYVLRQKQSLAESIPQVVSRILAFFQDPNQKIRYISISTLYNIFTNLADDCLAILTRTFKQLIYMIVDPSPDVRQAAQHLNHTMKVLLNDAILDHRQFDIKDFISILTQNFLINNPLTKQFLIDWIDTLDQITQFEVSFYLPLFLKQLLYLLINESKNLQTKALECLKGFIHGFRQMFKIKGDITCKLNQEEAENIIDILLGVIWENLSYQINLHALEWIDQFTQFFNQEVKTHKKPFFQIIFSKKFQSIISTVLQMISQQNQKVKQLAININKRLLEIFQLLNFQDTNTALILPHILKQSKSHSKNQAVIKWMKLLVHSDDQIIILQINSIIKRIVQKICDKTGKNIIGLLEKSIFTQKYFNLLIQILLNYIYQHPNLTVDHILRKIINHSNTHNSFIIICRNLIKYENCVFKFFIIDVLINILVTQQSLSQSRKQLLINQSTFKEIYSIFCYNQAALICLCFLTKHYHLVYYLLRLFGDQGTIEQHKISSLLKIVNLIQSPHMDHLKLSLTFNDHSACRSYIALILTLPSGKSTKILMKRLETCGVINMIEKIEDENIMNIKNKEIQEYIQIYKNTKKQSKILLNQQS